MICFMFFIVSHGIWIVASLLFCQVNVANCLCNVMGLDVTCVPVNSDLLSESFRPGKLLKDLEAAGVFLGVDRDTAVNLILASSQQVSAAKYAQNGAYRFVFLPLYFMNIHN